MSVDRIYLSCFSLLMVFACEQNLLALKRLPYPGVFSTYVASDPPFIESNLEFSINFKGF